MKQRHHSYATVNLDPALDAAGQRLVQCLNHAVDTLDDHTQQRLRAVREQAVDQRRNVLLQQAQLRHATSLSIQGHSLSLQPTNSWHHLGVFVMLLALLFGLWLIDNAQNDNFAMDAAEIDNLLLTDDLPPAAYVDPGFKHFLKLSFPAESL